MTCTLRSHSFFISFFINLTIICHEIARQCLATPSCLVRGDLYGLRCLVYIVFSKMGVKKRDDFFPTSKKDSVKLYDVH